MLFVGALYDLLDLTSAAGCEVSATVNVYLTLSKVACFAGNSETQCALCQNINFYSSFASCN